MKKLTILLLVFAITCCSQPQCDNHKLSKNIHNISNIYEKLPKKLQDKIIIKYSELLKGRKIESFKYDKVTYNFIKKQKLLM